MRPKDWLNTRTFRRITIIDRDGWSDREWEVMITEKEFMRRLAACTITFSTSEHPGTLEP